MKKFYFVLLSTLFIQLNLSASDSTKTKAPESFLKNSIRDAIRNNGNAKLDLYVMSQCPYGVNAEKIIIPILQEIGDSIDFNLYFIANEMSAGSFQSMHGEPEVLEDRRQLIIARHFRKNLPAYLLHRSSNYISANWEESALVTGIDVDRLNELMNRQDEMEAFSKNIRFAIGNKIFASPTLFINDIVYKGSFSLATENEMAWGTCLGLPSMFRPCDEDFECDRYCSGGFNGGKACVSSTDNLQGCPGTCVGGAADGGICWGTPGECIGGGTCVNFANKCEAKCAGPLCCDPERGCQKVSEVICDLTAGPNRWFAFIHCDQCMFSAAALRVESLNANYIEQSGTVEVRWQPEAGLPREFYVQRSRDGENFKDIAYIDDGAFNNNFFHFTDIQPYDVGHYRLVFPAKDGQTFSQVITAVSVKSGKLFLLPNPAKETVRVLLNNMQQFSTQISVADMSGRIVFQKTLTQGQCDVDISKLPAGIFIVRAAFNGQVYTSKLVKK